jgi:hypothetical protein
LVNAVFFFFFFFFFRTGHPRSSAVALRLVPEARDLARTFAGTIASRLKRGSLRRFRFRRSHNSSPSRHGDYRNRSARRIAVSYA